MTWYECIIAAHTAVTDHVSHGGRMKSKRYFVWHVERAMIGTTDLFTSMEFDPWCEALEKAFDASEHITWEKLQPMYEADTKIWHYRWRWEVSGCG